MQDLYNNVNIIQADPFEKYEFIRVLGRGSSSQIHQVKEKNTEKYYAMKIINPRSKSPEIIYNEFLQTCKPSSPNILCSYELYNYMEIFYIIEELMELTLANFIQEQMQLPEFVIAYIMKEILKGLHFIHTNNGIHRDLKTDNIFIDK